MFADHQPLISQWVRSHPDNMRDVAIFCIITAHWPFDRVRDDFDDVKSGDTSVLCGWKTEAVRLAHHESGGRFEQLETLWREDWGPDIMLAHVAQWYGLGHVKGGFFLQLCYGISGCLDVRNAELHGLQRSALRSDGDVRFPTRVKRASRYNELCERLGGTRNLWDTWCDLYALEYQGSRKDDFATGWQVSAEHCRVFGIDPGIEPEEVPF